MITHSGLCSMTNTFGYELQVAYNRVNIYLQVMELTISRKVILTHFTYLLQVILCFWSCLKL
jgi:hypothetical protein